MWGPDEVGSQVYHKVPILCDMTTQKGCNKGTGIFNSAPLTCFALFLLSLLISRDKTLSCPCNMPAHVAEYAEHTFHSSLMCLIT